MYRVKITEEKTYLIDIPSENVLTYFDAGQKALMKFKNAQDKQKYFIYDNIDVDVDEVE